MKEFEYMKILLSLIPEDIIEKYNLNELAYNGYVYIEIRKGMHGLPQAGILAHKELQQHLEPFGYTPCKVTPGLWKHVSNGVTFTLVVDDFLIKYKKKEDIHHLLNALRKKYEISTDYTASKYCGITLEWNWKTQTCDLSIPEYLEHALETFNHSSDHSPQHSPYPCSPLLKKNLKEALEKKRFQTRTVQGFNRW